MTLIPLPALRDNYIWLLHDQGHALVVDPGDAGPVWDVLRHDSLVLSTILVTHHHTDHTGGVADLQQATGAAVYGPAGLPPLPCPWIGLHDSDIVQALGHRFAVMHIPGHTADHIAYFGPCDDDEPLLFCGDTLFGAGCGRLFEGTPAQMLASLTRLAALPDATRVCSAHEYTVDGLRFAHWLEPENAYVADRLAWALARRASHLPTLPSTLGLEKSTNPFLRTHQPAVVSAVLPAMQLRCAANPDPVSVFAALRTLKDQF